MKQVSKDHYSFSNYVSLQRWISYWYQIKEISNLDVESVIEIGPGSKNIGDYLTSNLGVYYKTVDVARDLKPDFLGSVDSIPLDDNSFDLVCAFQVLEHLPYDRFQISLKEMSRVAKKYVIFSLPHYGPNINVSVKIPFFKQFRFSMKFLLPKKHVWDGQHYWEIGKKTFEYSKVKTDIVQVLDIVKDFVPFENSYHHFFICKVR